MFGDQPLKAVSRQRYKPSSDELKILIDILYVTNKKNQKQWLPYED